jgi:AcrR family transcriptional regulator
MLRARSAPAPAGRTHRVRSLYLFGMQPLLSDHPDVRPLLAGAGSAQRARLLGAIATTVAEKGYAEATVADIVREARVSRSTFYEQFASKEDCFLESYRHGVDVLVERIAEATRAAASGGWRAQLRAGLRTYLAILANEPQFARTHMLELHAAGARAQAARDEALRRFAGRYRRSFESAAAERDGAPLPSDDLLFILSAGVDQLVSAHVREGRLDRLPQLEDTLVQAAEALFEGVANIDHTGSA